MSRRTPVRLLTTALVVGSAALGFAPMAAQASTDKLFAPAVEAWFQPNPTCLTPAGCLTAGSSPVAPPVAVPSLPAVNPYTAGTMHVGVTAGTETARTYLRFAFEQLDGLNVTGATLSIPLDVNPQDGSTAPEASKAIVCETSSSNIAPSEGTIDAPPPSDCAVSVKLTYAATPTPHLTANLGQMAADLPGITGLVLLPDASAAQSDAWQLVFSAHTRADAAKTAPAALTVTVDDGAAPDVDLGTVDVPVEVPAVALPDTSGLGGVSGVVPVTGTGFAEVPTVQSPTTAGSAPTVSVPQAAAPVTEPRLITVGYAYPGVWLLPFGFLVLVPLVARALTKDMSDTR